MNRVYIFILLALTGSFIFCSNPLEESETQKEKIRLLVDQTFTESGRYVYYWDGKDDDGKYVEPGKYLYAMETKNYDQINYMIAEIGGKTGSNNEEHWEPGYWNSFVLEDAYPDPFYIESGVNIPFLVSTSARIKITIYKD